jgi:hypothetical protein
MVPRMAERLATLRRFFWLSVGIVFIAIGLIGIGPAHAQLSPSRRVIAGVAGLFFVYCGSLYYLPKYRKRREELDKELDELEAPLK